MAARTEHELAPSGPAHCAPVCNTAACASALVAALLQDVLRGAADEVLAVLKNKDLRDPERQKECVGLLGSCEDDMFARLVALGKRITDYVTEAEVRGREVGARGRGGR